MYQLSPPAVYAHESVMANPLYRQRMQRVVDACDNDPEIITWNDDDLPELLAPGGLLSRYQVMGSLDKIEDPVLLFNTYKFDGGRVKRREWLDEQGIAGNTLAIDSMLGHGAFAWACYNLPDDPAPVLAATLPARLRASLPLLRTGRAPADDGQRRGLHREPRPAHGRASVAGDVAV